jgi:hypothetical protein
MGREAHAISQELEKVHESKQHLKSLVALLRGIADKSRQDVLLQGKAVLKIRCAVFQEPSSRRYISFMPSQVLNSL